MHPKKSSNPKMLINPLGREPRLRARSSAVLSPSHTFFLILTAEPMSCDSHHCRHFFPINSQSMVRALISLAGRVLRSFLVRSIRCRAFELPCFVWAGRILQAMGIDTFPTIRAMIRKLIFFLRPNTPVCAIPREDVTVFCFGIRLRMILATEGKERLNRKKKSWKRRSRLSLEQVFPSAVVASTTRLTVR